MIVIKLFYDQYAGPPVLAAPPVESWMIFRADFYCLQALSEDENCLWIMKKMPKFLVIYLHCLHNIFLLLVW